MPFVSNFSSWTGAIVGRVVGQRRITLEMRWTIYSPWKYRPSNQRLVVTDSHRTLAKPSLLIHYLTSAVPRKQPRPEVRLSTKPRLLLEIFLLIETVARLRPVLSSWCQNLRMKLRSAHNISDAILQLRGQLLPRTAVKASMLMEHLSEHLPP